MNRHASKVAGMSDAAIDALVKQLKREIPDAQALLAQLLRTQKHRRRAAAKEAERVALRDAARDPEIGA